jgi:tetratricopeptide (TPR) repeat protein
MAAKHHMDREELKRDEVAETFKTLAEDFNQHRTAILATLGLLVLAFAVWTTLNRRGEAAAMENAEIFGAAHELIGNARFSEDVEQRNADLQAAVESLQTIVDKRGSSPAGLHALYLQGNAYYAMDDYASASGAFEAVIQNSGSAERTASAGIALGQTLESQSFLEEAPEKLNDALEQYEKAASAALPDSYLHALALLNQARVHELQGNTDKAVGIYQSIVETRDSPREDVPGAKDEPEQVIEIGNPFMDNLFEEAVEGATRMNFRAQAQARLDQLEAASPARATSEAP